MKRRDFMSWIGLGTLATSLPVAIAAVSNPSPPRSSAAVLIEAKPIRENPIVLRPE